MYTSKNYRTKKELLADLKAGVSIDVFQPLGDFFPGKTDGYVCLEGPHYPESHRWFAGAIIKDSRVVSAK